MLETNDARHKFRMTDIMPQPKSIVDILEAGIANPIYATCAMAEALLQVY